MTTRHYALVSVLLLGVLGKALPAQAQCSGTLTGTLLHAQRAGGWCDPDEPLSLGCTGSKYLVDEVTKVTITAPPSAQVDLKGIPEVPFVVRKESNGMIVAQGVTDANGSFSTTFTEPCAPGFFCLPTTCNGSSFDVTVEVPVRHQSGSMTVGYWYVFGSFEWTMVTAPFGFVRAPNVVLTAKWGNWADPSPILNIYTSARRTWSRLRTSERLLSNVPTAFISWPDESCDSASSCSRCEEGDDAIVHIGTDDAMSAMVVSHELGHAAECAAHTSEFDSGRDYSRDGSSHGFLTEEFRSAAYAEGFANFVGQSVLYNDQATSPLLCIERSSVPCTLSNAATLLESPLLGLGSCTSAPGDHSRQELFIASFLWDLWDERVDVDSLERTDTVDEDFNDIIHTLDEFPQGSDNHEENEHRCCFLWNCWACGSPENDSGHNLSDFVHHWAPLPLGQVREMNCSP